MFKVDLCGAPPGFGYYRLKEDDEDIVQKFAKFLRGNYCLDPSRFYKWFYGLVSKSKDAAKRGITASTREGRSVVKLSISGMDDENVHPVIRGKGLPPAVDPPKKLNSVHDLLYREEAAGRLTWALQPPSRQQDNDLLWEFTFQPIEETWLGKTICRRMVGQNIVPYSPEKRHIASAEGVLANFCVTAPNKRFRLWSLFLHTSPLWSTKHFYLSIDKNGSMVQLHIIIYICIYYYYHYCWYHCSLLFLLSLIFNYYHYYHNN